MMKMSFYCGGRTRGRIELYFHHSDPYLLIPMTYFMTSIISPRAGMEFDAHYLSVYWPFFRD